MAKPTNTDLAKKMDKFEERIGSRVNAIGKIAMETQAAVSDLTTWRATKMAADQAAKEAVENYKRDNPNGKSDKTTNANLIEIAKYALMIAAAAIAGKLL